jgi:hypothetical protein
LGNYSIYNLENLAERECKFLDWILCQVCCNE